MSRSFAWICCRRWLVHLLFKYPNISYATTCVLVTDLTAVPPSCLLLQRVHLPAHTSQEGAKVVPHKSCTLLPGSAGPLACPKGTGGGLVGRISTSLRAGQLQWRNACPARGMQQRVVLVLGGSKRRNAPAAALEECGDPAVKLTEHNRLQVRQLDVFLLL